MNIYALACYVNTIYSPSKSNFCHRAKVTHIQNATNINIIIVLFTYLFQIATVYTNSNYIQQVFLLAHCKDNGLYLRTLATGTELHSLKGHKSKVCMEKREKMYTCQQHIRLMISLAFYNILAFIFQKFDWVFFQLIVNLYKSMLPISSDTRYEIQF